MVFQGRLNGGYMDLIDLDVVDLSSLQIGGIYLDDYPDFCDAYFSHGKRLDGTQLSDDELERLTDDFPDMVHEMALNTFY
jgi:hypothetical protein